jgi:hypothetical protein
MMLQMIEIVCIAIITSELCGFSAQPSGLATRSRRAHAGNYRLHVTTASQPCCLH